MANSEINMSSLRSDLTDAQRALLEKRLRGELTGVAKKNSITPRTDQHSLVPLSFAQQRLWFLEQLSPGGFVYNLPTSMRIKGPLIVAALERTLSEIIRRHEILRTSFIEIEGQPFQVVAPAHPVSLPITDLSELSSADREIQAQKLASDDARKPLNLARSPALRSSLLRLSNEEHILLFTLNHIVSDGWSVGVLVREVTRLYEAFCGGNVSPLPELPIQYADYALWQRQRLQGDLLEAELAYWKEQLAGAASILELPANRPRPVVQTFRGAALKKTLSRAVSDDLRAISQRENATLFMLLMAAFNVWLYRHTGQEDIVIGAPVAGRNRPETEGMIGYFANTLALRSKLSGLISFRQFLHSVREVALQAYTHQDLPFELLVEALQPERDLSHNPIFQVVFALQNVPLTELKLRDISVSFLEIEHQAAKFDLSLIIWHGSNGLTCSFEYNTDLFDTSTIIRMADRFHMLLDGIIANPGNLISELPLLTDSERHQLLAEAGNARADFRSDQSLHSLFEAQVERTPDAIAAVYNEKALTYRNLNDRANQLANYLQKYGVGPETLVGICIERSLDTVLAILGALKAGAAYVPIDPSYPKERLAFIVNDSRVSVLLTRAELAESFSEPAVRLICMDAERDAISKEKLAKPRIDLTLDNPAYVIYTSGSTGKPKGVMVSHHNVARLMRATESWFHFDETDTWTMFHSYAFDFSVWEMWGALLYGGRVVIVPYWVSRSPDAFYELLQLEQVTILNQTPSAFSQLIRTIELSKIERDLKLRLIIFGGEALDLSSLKPWFDRYGDLRPRLVNMYGITETTVHVTYRPIAIEDLRETSKSVIGIPIPDLQIYILDKNQHLAPLEVPGEIYVGGEGLARNYLNHADLTAERFVPDPFSNRPGARLYRSGDLARHTQDGDIDYLGRIDNQVKIRGFRIELGEIETVLCAHAAVRDCAVVALGDVTGGNRLVAYVAGQQKDPLPIDELRSFLKSKLPDHMIPSVFVAIDALPLTAHGKVDRKALALPDESRPELSREFVSPRNAVEAALAEIWTEVLGVNKIGIDDNYFALGGDSIRSIQIRVKAADRGLNFTLQQLFKLQTIRELASELAIIESRPEAAKRIQPFDLISANDRLKIPQDIEDAYPLTMLQAGMIFHSEYNPDSAFYHNITSAHLQAPFSAEKMQRAIEQLAFRHDAIRTSFDLINFSEPLQLVHRNVSMPLQVEDLRHLAPEQQERILDEWLKAERGRKFDLTHAPLLRFHIHRRSEKTFQFSLAEHHSILDGWSVATMLTELFQRYFLLLNEQDCATDPMAMAFRDFVALERQILQSEETRSFWSEKLSEIEIAKLPRSISYQSNAAAQFRLLDVPLTEETSEGLKNLALAAAVPIKSVLLAAHLKVISALSGSADVLTGYVSNSRPETADAERVLGLFLNTLPFRQKLGGGTYLQLARETFESEQEILLHRAYPMAQLQQMIGNEAMFDTAFNFTHFHVYEGLQSLEGFKVLGGAGFEQTNFTITANFSLDLISSRVMLGLSCNATELGIEIETIGKYYAKALVAMASDREGRYDALWLASAQEQYRILHTYNDTGKAYSLDECISRQFERQVERTPDAPAVSFEQEQLTYRELNSISNQLAHHLQALGAGPDCLVGVCMERSLHMVISLLAILKSGGAYVPLDPLYPQERLDYILEETGLSIVLTQQPRLASLPKGRAQIVCVEEAQEAIRRESRFNPENCADPECRAYVIYTSGSTGRPKGVMNTNRAVLNRLMWMQEAYQLTSSDRVLQKTPYTFDVSAWEFFWPLLTGAKLVVARPGGHQDTAYLTGLIRKQQITTMHFVPSMLRMFLEEPQVSECRALKRVICSGEALPLDLKQLFFARMKSAELHNLYGPTEAAIDVTYWQCGSDDQLPVVPIGRPISNIQIYVLDQHLNPSPLNVAGELRIGGIGLARGYLSQPSLTAEKFMPNPFSKEPGARLYNTGDRARFLGDGAIEFLGRIDYQVKVRGFRIELGEIESALSLHPSVREAAVKAIEDAPGGKRLLAFVTVNTEHPPSIEELRAHLKERLPEYMLPSAFAVLAQMPLTPSGKIDRKALKPPDQTRPEIDELFVAPRTAAEQMLSLIWSRVLGVEPVGIYDNFFSLGGDSIRSISVISQAREQGLSFSLQQLFKHPTIAELAKIDNDSTDHPLTTIGGEPFSLISAEDRMKLPEDVEDAYPLATLQAGLVFHTHLWPETTVYHDILTCRIRNRFDSEAFKDAVRWIVERHPILRTTYDLTSFNQPLQLVHKNAEAPLRIYDLRSLLPAEQEKALATFLDEEKRWRFDWGHPSLVRIIIHILSDDACQYTLSFHDSTLDGWSVSAFNTELFQTYTALLAGSLIPDHPRLAASYRDFVALEQMAIDSDTCKQYWEPIVTGDASMMFPRQHSSKRRAEAVRIRYFEVPIPVDVSNKLKKLALLATVPLKSVLLAAHSKALSVLCGRAEVLTGIEHNGRAEEKGGERVLGLFLNTVPFKLTIDGGNWLDLARRTFEAEMELLPYRRYPMANLQRKRGGQPLFDTVFNYTHFHVAGSLNKLQGIELLAMSTVLETEYPLRAEFNRTLQTDRLQLSLHYNEHVLGEDQVINIANYYLKVLTSMADDPYGQHRSQCFLSDEELQRILIEWQRTKAEVPLDQCFHQLFEAQVKRTPDAFAVCDEYRSLSYSALNERANRMARGLIEQGFGADAVAALLAERSADFLTAVLAIFKAGGAYLPLDPRHPSKQIRQVILQSGCEIIVSSNQFIDFVSQAIVDCSPNERPEILSLEHMLQTEQASEDLPSRSMPNSLAYVIYTSGSTGVPKGAMIEHRGMLNHLYAKIADLKLTEADVVAQTASQCFDISVWQFLAALLVGGRVHVCKDEVAFDPSRLLAMMEQEEVSIFETVPSMLRAILAQVSSLAAMRPRLPALRWLIPTGEALPPGLCRQWLTRFPNAPIMNAYGPTECSDDVSHNQIFEPISEDNTRVPIGRPVINTKLYVLDQMMLPVPVGVPGDLYVGGVGVGRGYCNDPARTAPVFVPDPYGQERGTRLYKTGDLAAYLPDGKIEFLGRIDHQVKIRGFRIELGAIEAALARCANVRDCAVITQDGESGDKRLVAYVVFDTEQVRAPAELRYLLSQELPDYMVPSAFVVMDALPLTPNGKLDRRSLPDPDTSRPVIGADYIQPETELERVIARIWQDVLRLDKVGMRDNFFDLGGHSLLIIQAQNKLREALNRDIPMIEIFRNPTIAALANYLRQEQAEEFPMSDVQERVETVRSSVRRQRKLREKRQEAREAKP